MVIEIDNKLVSTELLEQKFICDLKKCKGACCVEGDSGAPVTAQEVLEIEKSLSGIQEFMRPEGIAAIENDGVSYLDKFNEKVVTLVDGGACAFVTFDEQGTALCAIEKAHKAGKSTLKKPISCHLYPIRVSKNNLFEVLNFHEWDICGAACVLGETLGVPVYQFLKEPLISAYGEEFFQTLEEAERLWKEQEKNK
jgi:hypothetical protein